LLNGNVPRDGCTIYVATAMSYEEIDIS